MSDILERAMNGLMGCCDCDGNQECFRECGMEISRLRYEVARLRLTDAERAAVKDAISCCEDITYGGAADQEAADVLKALLERTK